MSKQPPRKATTGLEIQPPFQGPLWSLVWRRPDPGLAMVGLANERLLAHLRISLVLLILLLYVPVVGRFEPIPPIAFWTGVALLAVMVLQGLVVYVAARRNLLKRWFLLAGSVLNVTIVSAILGVFLLVDRPYVAVNSRVIFCGYFLVIAATALHYDARASILTGLVAILQYGIIVLVAYLGWPLNDPSHAPFTYGLFNWSDQFGRLILMAAATVISANTVIRFHQMGIWSTRDPLTGAYNRAYVQERLVQEVMQARRSGNPLTVALVDVDHLKRYNDSYGHHVGDEVLRTVADAIGGVFRVTDVVARYGGDEFLMIIPGSQVDDALPRLESLPERIAELSRRTPRIALRVPTVSIGAAECPADGSTAEDLLRAADRRLYLAKQAGRNQVVAAGGS